MVRKIENEATSAKESDFQMKSVKIRLISVIRVLKSDLSVWRWMLGVGSSGASHFQSLRGSKAMVRQAHHKWSEKKQTERPTLFPTHYSLPAKGGQAHYSLLITHYSLLITHYSLLITHYSLLTSSRPWSPQPPLSDAPHR